MIAIMARSILLALLASFLATLTYAQASGYWTTEHAMQVRNTGGAKPSADGKWVAYTETRQIMESDKSESNTQIWLARADATRIQGSGKHGPGLTLIVTMVP